MLCRAYLLSRVQLFATLCIVAHQAPLSMWFLQARILEWVAVPSSRGSSQPRDWTQVAHITGGFLTVWAQEYQGRPGILEWMDSLSLLQGIFPTQQSNPDLLHCRWILYCLSHQGGPHPTYLTIITVNTLVDSLSFLLSVKNIFLVLQKLDYSIDLLFVNLSVLYVVISL